MYSINIRDETSGIYGVGKSTLSSKIKEIISFPDYSASELITMNNNEKYHNQGKFLFIFTIWNSQIMIFQMLLS